MAKVSDEIRGWCDDAYSGRKIRSVNDLYAIADRIDSEMAELPKDADGVPIHVGDKVYLPDGHKTEVGLIDISRSKHGIAFWVGGKDFLHVPKNITHTRPDSLDNIARDLEDWAEGNISGSAQSFANRIRELEKKEGKR